MENWERPGKQLEWDGQRSLEEIRGLLEESWRMVEYTVKQCIVETQVELGKSLERTIGRFWKELGKDIERNCETTCRELILGLNYREDYT